MADDRYEWQRLAARIRRRIAAGEWPVGSRIPTVRNFVQSEKLSDNTVTKALAALADEGLIEGKVGIGTIVIASPSTLPATVTEQLADLQDRVSALEAAERRRASEA